PRQAPGDVVQLAADGLGQLITEVTLVDRLHPDHQVTVAAGRTLQTVHLHAGAGPCRTGQQQRVAFGRGAEITTVLIDAGDVFHLCLPGSGPGATRSGCGSGSLTEAA